VTGARPLDQLDALGVQDVEVGPRLAHVEVFTLGGLLTILWHGDRDAEGVVVAGGGAMGGLLGPADGLYHDLGRELAARGYGMMRVGWRRPNDLVACVLDLAASIDLAARKGGCRFVTMGHSFGGAVAVSTAATLGQPVVGVVTLSTQSAGCETADLLGDRPLLLFHGDRDELLPPSASEMVRMMAGHGELVLLPGAGHLLVEAAVPIRERLLEWLPDVLAEPAQ
jgi:pimeloyl-ACP methyl ester carboxylesterase